MTNDEALGADVRDEQFLEGEPPAYLLIDAVALIADRIISIRLVSEDGADLPSWSPGAHIDLVLPSRRVRSYSLSSDPHDRSHYEIAVLREDESLGGSVELHDLAKVGMRLGFIGPRNHFELVDAPEYFFLAGGIGITPILPMLAEVQRREVPWRCWYAGRNAEAMAYLDEVSAYGNTHTATLFEDEVGRPDIATLFSALKPGTVVYCCGPKGMIAAAEAASWRIGTRQLHIERFHPTLVPASVLSFGHAFDVRLERHDVVLHVPAERSLLSVVRDVVPSAPSSCGSGSCGVCETSVLAGEIEHRDRVLSAEECARGDVMMICVSRAKSDLLVLDI